MFNEETGLLIQNLPSEFATRVIFGVSWSKLYPRWQNCISCCKNLLSYVCAKNYRNRTGFNKVIAKDNGAVFLEHSEVSICAYLHFADKEWISV